jgi:hypothetical protein
MFSSNPKRGSHVAKQRARRLPRAIAPHSMAHPRSGSYQPLLLSEVEPVGRPLAAAKEVGLDVAKIENAPQLHCSRICYLAFPLALAGGQAAVHAPMREALLRTCIGPPPAVLFSRLHFSTHAGSF